MERFKCARCGETSEKSGTRLSRNGNFYCLYCYHHFILPRHDPKTVAKAFVRPTDVPRFHTAESGRVYRQILQDSFEIVFSFAGHYMARRPRQNPVCDWEVLFDNKPVIELNHGLKIGRLVKALDILDTYVTRSVRVTRADFAHEILYSNGF